MKATQKYNVEKRLLPVMLGGAMMFASCNKDDNKPTTPQPTPGPVQTKNVVIKLNGNIWNGGIGGNGPDVNDTTSPNYKVSDVALMPLQADQSIDTIFLEPYGNWTWLPKVKVDRLVTRFKTVRTDYPKTWGKGDFTFDKGYLSEADSLWFVQNGWTINRQR